MSLQLPSWVTDPIGWINTQVRAFMGLPARYDSMLNVARDVFTAEAQYRATHGNYMTQSPRELAAITSINQLEEWQRGWNAIHGKLVFATPPDSLGQIVVSWTVIAVTASIAAVVWGIYGLLNKVSPAEDFVFNTLPHLPGVTPEQALEAFRLQQESKSGIEQLLGGTAKLIAMAALAIGVYYFAPVIARKVR